MPEELILWEFEIEPDPEANKEKEKTRSGKIRSSIDQLPLTDPPACIKIPGADLKDFEQPSAVYSAVFEVKKYWSNNGKTVKFETRRYPKGDDKDPTPFYRVWRIQ